MYCLKCKQHTESTNIQQKIAANNRLRLSAICTVCGKKKSQFIKKASGQGVFNDILTKASNVREFHLPVEQGEYVPNGSFNNQKNYSYCGPGTKYKQRIEEGYQGINELDSMCKLHDQFYTDNSDTTSRNISDEALAHRALEIANNQSFDSTQRNMANLVHQIMKNRARFGLGNNSKNLKKGPMNRK